MWSKLRTRIQARIESNRIGSDSKRWEGKRDLHHLQYFLDDFHPDGLFSTFYFSQSPSWSCIIAKPNLAQRHHQRRRFVDVHRNPRNTRISYPAQRSFVGGIVVDRTRRGRRWSSGQVADSQSAIVIIQSPSEYRSLIAIICANTESCKSISL